MATQTQSEIRQTFNTEQGFVDLMFEMGVGDNERDRFVNDGFGAIRDLIEQYEHDIESFRTYLRTLNRTFGASTNPDKRVYFPPPVMSRMIGALYYGVITYHSCHMLPDFALLTPNFAMDCYKFYEGMKKEDNPEAEKQIELDIPDFKGATNWRSFRDLVIMKLALIKGKNGFPIDYVTDTTERQAQRSNAARMIIDIVPITDDDFLKTHVVHFNKSFKDDNKRVWHVLKALIHETNAYDHVLDCDKTSNGRKAWLTLKKFYEGEDFKQRLQDEAFSILNQTIYRGESPRYNFESYVNRHIKAHKLLIEAEYNKDQISGEVRGMDESTKNQHFRTGIRLEAGLEQELSSARTLSKHRSTFADYVSYLQTEVNNKNQRKQELKTTTSKRGVSKVEHETRSKGGGRPKWRMIDGKRIEAKKYPRKEWLNLTQNQKNAVIEMYAQSKGRNSNNQGRRSNVDIKSVQSSIKQDLIDVGDAIVSKIIRFDGDETEKTENQSQSDAKSTKRKVKSGGIGDFLSKRGKRE